MEELFRFDGRANRKSYWISSIVGGLIVSLTVLVVILLSVAEANGEDTTGLPATLVVMCIASVIVMISVTSYQVRRWHDLDKSGWWVLIGLVPFGGIYSFIMLGFVAGTPGKNSYDLTPSGKSQPKKVEAVSLYSGSVSAKKAAEIERKTVV